MYFFSVIFPVWMFLIDASNAIKLRSKHAPIGFTRNGSYYGTTVPSLGQDIFLGIPFAYAPRFEVAQSLNSSFTTPKPATTPGLTCSGFGTNVVFGWPVGEDCLNLNIVRPSKTYRAAKLPVLVWIYGGGFVQGSNRDPEFNTSYIVETSVQINKPIIVVSINYRLSGFGLLGGAEMMAAGVLNLAIRDQWKALEWINQNIEGFGGFPNDVTIWGESGGADSVAILLQAYGGNNSGLFKKAIMVSGAVVGSAYLTPAQEQMQFEAVANATGCLNANNRLQCLKDVPYSVLNATLAAGPLLYYFPTTDGDIIRVSASTAFNSNPPLLAPVDIITGCNSDEGIFIQTALNTSAQLSDYLLSGFWGYTKNITDTLLALYPDGEQFPPYNLPMDVDWPALTATVGVQSGNETRRVYGLVGDIILHAGRRLLASSWGKVLPGKKVWSYRWDVDPSQLSLVYTAGLGVGFAQHGAELSYEFRLPYISGSPYPPLPKVPAMQNVSYAMQAHWVSFAATGDPNNHGLSWIPRWPAYGENSQNFVYNATLSNLLNNHIEDDTYRAAGISYINSLWGFIIHGTIPFTPDKSLLYMYS